MIQCEVSNKGGAGLGLNKMAPVRYNRMRDDTITLVCGRRNAIFCKGVKLMLLRSIVYHLFFRSDYCNSSCFHRLPSADSTRHAVRSPQQQKLKSSTPAPNGSSIPVDDRCTRSHGLPPVFILPGGLYAPVFVLVIDEGYVRNPSRETIHYLPQRPSLLCGSHDVVGNELQDPGCSVEDDQWGGRR